MSIGLARRDTRDARIPIALDDRASPGRSGVARAERVPMTPPSEPRTLTLQEAAAACGTTARALQRRIDRGTLRSVLVNDRRRVPVSELVRVGLLAAADTGHGTAGAGSGQSHGVAATNTSARAAPVLDVRELLDRLLEQERHYAQLAATTEQAEARVREAEERAASEKAEADRLRGELWEVNARVQALEQAATRETPAETPTSRDVELAAPVPPRRPGWAFWRKR